MIPLVDDFLQLFIANKIKWLKNHPKVIDHIFYTGKRETLDKLKDFIVKQKIKVIIGYPRDQTSLPAYVITLAPEQEQPLGLGDDSGAFDELQLGGDVDISDYDENYEYDDEEDTEEEDEETTEKVVKNELAQFLANTYMNATYRIECWSDNGDLTAYLYVILKWCLWSSRMEMLKLGWVNIRLSGTDLEPVPDYMPVFIYRRASQIAITYENLYYENVNKLGKYLDILDDPEKYPTDEDGNIVDEKTGEIIIPADTWILRPHYYEELVSYYNEESRRSKGGNH